MTTDIPVTQADVDFAAAQAQVARMRKALERFVMVLTDGGRNQHNMLSIDHARLSDCIDFARLALAADAPEGDQP